MSVEEKRKVWRAAVDLMVDAAVARTQPNNPGAYAAGTRSNILNGPMRDQARGLLDDDPSLTPEKLVELLEASVAPAPAPQAPTVRLHADRTCCATCGCYGGGGWLQSPDRDGTWGTLPDLIPCPACAVDRHRLHDREHVREDREEMHRGYQRATEEHRERYGSAAIRSTLGGQE